MADRELGDLAAGRTFPAAFGWVRSTYDFFLTQEARIQKGLDREAYVRRLAESGFTHVEVNGLAFPTGIESGPPGEAYPMSTRTVRPSTSSWRATSAKDSIPPITCRRTSRSCAGTPNWR